MIDGAPLLVARRSLLIFKDLRKTDVGVVASPCRTDVLSAASRLANAILRKSYRYGGKSIFSQLSAKARVSNFFKIHTKKTKSFFQENRN